VGEALVRNVGMKLLIITQAIDLDDPILGFFHRWVEELAKRFEHIEVICLKLGRHSLPGNVSVHSLRKEKGRRSRFMYATYLGWLIWKLRPKYDAVLVHMNPEYVILGGVDWRLMGKKIYFWYNHPNKDLRFKIAARLAHKIFYTSRYSAGADMPHALRMPAGIDTDLFKPQSVTRIKHAFYMQGRIAPSKHVEIALAALRLVRKEVPDVTLTLVGPEDEQYGKGLRKEFADVMSAVTFVGSKRNEETPMLYSAHRASINLAARGHYDKSVLESMACETPAIVSSSAFAGLTSPEWIVAEDDPEALARALKGMIAIPEMIYKQIGKDERKVVIEREGLNKLGEALFAAMYTL